MTHAGEWYFEGADGQKGPFTREQMSALQSGGAVNAATLVWSEPLPGWVPFGQSLLAADVSVSGAPTPVMPTLPHSDPDVNSFAAAISTCFSKYATFSGRAGRAEYWYFMLFITVAAVGTAIADAALFTGDVSPLNAIFSLGIILPELAVMVRRLHDTDRSGWWLLLILVPFAGIIALIVFWCQRATPGRNRFG